MNWTNKATTRGLRLAKEEQGVYTEIGYNYGWGSLVIECEDIAKGKRLYYEKVSVGDLLKEFPELKNWETILYAYEKQNDLITKIKELENKIKNYIKNV